MDLRHVLLQPERQQAQRREEVRLWRYDQHSAPGRQGDRCNYRIAAVRIDHLSDLPCGHGSDEHLHWHQCSVQINILHAGHFQIKAAAQF